MQKLSKLKTCVLALLILLSNYCFSQTGNIKGKVFTSDGQPAPNVSVTVPSLHKGTITNENGAFMLRNLPEGDVLLLISHTGMETVEEHVTVEDTRVTESLFKIKQNTIDLQKVVVDGRRPEQKPLTIGKAGIDPMDLPQATAVIGQSVIRDQQSNRLSDVVKNVNGVYLSTTRGSTQESFSARGYSLGATNIFKNGTRINSGAMPEMSSLERVEVLKGSAAILFGNVAPGGIINLVTKQPKFRSGGEVSVRGGSYGFLKPAFDVYGPLSTNIAYRVNGTFETADSYRKNVHSDRYYINPSFLFRLGQKTELLVEGDYLKHHFTPDFGIGSVDGKYISPLGRSTFLGVPWARATTQQATANVTLKHKLSDNWQLLADAAYQSYSRDYYSTERIQIKENGDWVRPLGRTNTMEDYLTASVNFNGKFSTGKIQHQVLIGADAEKYYTANYGYDQPKTYDTINIFDEGKYTRRTDIPQANQVRLVKTPVNRAGAYIQDLITLTPKLKLLAGIRWTYQLGQKADSLNFITGERTFGESKTDKAFSPRFGVVYRPVDNVSLFASYANSFSVNKGIDVSGNALSPSIIDQFEFGVKNEFIKGLLSANLTFYRIINNNLAQTAPFKADGSENNDPSIKALVGQTTSDGVELDVTSEPVKGLHLMAGYSYNKMRFTNIDFIKGNYVKGERLVNTPANTANASAFYTFSNDALKGLKIGASVFYIGKRFGGWNNTIVDAATGETTDRLIAVSGFTTVDISAGFCFSKNLSVLARVSNLTNTLNYYVHENYSINPIAPRQFMATVNYKF